MENENNNLENDAQKILEDAQKRLAENEKTFSPQQVDAPVKKRKYTKRKNTEEQVIPPTEQLIEYEADDLKTIIEPILRFLDSRSPYPQGVDDNFIHNLSEASAKVATKYGATFLKFTPEISLGVLVFNFTLSRYVRAFVPIEVLKKYEEIPNG